MNAFEYPGTILCKHESMEGETRERTAKGRYVMGVLESYERKKIGNECMRERKRNETGNEKMERLYRRKKIGNECRRKRKKTERNRE